MSTDQNFLTELYADIFDRANQADAEALRHNAFAEVLLSRLEEANMIPPARVAYADIEGSSLRGQLHGYSFDIDESQLMLFYCIEANANTPLDGDPKVTSVSKDEVDRGFRRLEGFVRAVKMGKVESIDIADPAYEAILLIRECLEKDYMIYLYTLVSGMVSERTMEVSNANFHKEVWDLRQFVRYCSGSGDDKVSVNFHEEFGITLPSLATEANDDGIQVFLSSIPGEVLAQIYINHRSRLLERNVRSFLQLTGKVNKGIRSTVAERPSCFLPFNNGLAATASNVDIEYVGDGLARIKAIHDFQIVNGGQTTATIASCKLRDRFDLSQINVAMKLTVVPSEDVDVLVPLISRYANAQNKVQESDFEANHPWQIELERHSRVAWTPPSVEAPRGTRWFYERSRGQYSNDVSAQGSRVAKTRFSRENPNKQKITKTDLAKYLLSWEQLPHIVNRGGQSAFLELMRKVSKEAWDLPDRRIFNQTIGLSILFKSGETIYGQLGYTGYRANFVSYAISLLSYDLSKSLPFEVIWDTQRLPARVSDMLRRRIVAVNELLLPKQLEVKRFSTYLKSEQCWQDVLELANSEPLTEEFESYLTKLPKSAVRQRVTSLVDEICQIDADVWFNLSGWAIAYNQMEPSDRILAFSISQILKRGQRPSREQAQNARRVLTTAVELGYSNTSLSAQLLSRLASTT